jgi:V/A-type H+-transporting ATPase subunit G/H
MAKDKILSEIKQAETNARIMVDSAAKEKNDRISKARVEAREIIKQAEVDAHKSSQSTLRSAEHELASQKQKIIEEGIKEADIVAKNAKAKVDQAAKNLISEFERAIHA